MKNMIFWVCLLGMAAQMLAMTIDPRRGDECIPGMALCIIGLAAALWIYPEDL